MNLSNPDTALGLPGRGDQRAEQAAEHGAHVVAPIEAELDLGEVAVAVLGEFDGVVRTRQRRLDVADERVDGAELLVEHAGLAAACDLAVVDGAHRCSHREAAQAVGDDGQRQAHAGGDELLHRLLGERSRRQACQVCPAVLGGLHRHDEGHLVLRAAAGLAAAALPAEIGVVDLDAAGELPLGLGQRHGLQQLVLDEPGGAVAHAQLAGQLQRRDVVLGLRQQLHGQEPARQRQLGGLEDGAAGDAALVLAAGALPVQAAFAPERGARLHHAAGGADEPAGPARGDERLLALLLGAVAVHELRQRQPLLELDSVHRHGTSPGGMRPSSALSGSQNELAELHR